MHLTQKWMDAVAASSTGQCLVASGTSDIYSKVTEPTLAPFHLQGMQLSLLNDQLPENAAGFLLLLLDFLSQIAFFTSIIGGHTCTVKLCFRSGNCCRNLKCAST